VTENGTRRLEVMRQLGAGDIAAVRELLAVAEEADGHAPLGEHQWLDLVQGGRAGFAGLVASEAGHEHPVGYAQVSRGRDGWAIEYVVDPHHRTDAVAIGADLVQGALGVIRDEGGGHVHLWVSHPSPVDDAIAAAGGLRPGRDLYQMRRPLPVDEKWSLDTRAFVPGQDEDAWLDVNNRAFEWHPEQGGWDRSTLAERESEPWFDPAGFLLHERDGKLVGFCWTKVHGEHDPPLGEIYVVAVDPNESGQGLGRALVLAGLDHLARQGIRVGMLYVDASNVRAVKLYVEMGFLVNHVDRAYTGDISPS
jgi:mycothiol synthase